MAIQASPDIEHGYKLARQGAAVVEPESWSSVEVKGPDAVEFLQGQVTNDVEVLEPGGGCYALLLNPKGRILADMRILMRGPKELCVDGEAAAMEIVVANLGMYRIGRQVEVSPLPRTHRDVISVFGPTAREAVGFHPSSEEHAFVDGEINGVRTLAVATDLGLDLIFDASGTDRIRDAVPESVPVGVAEILRIERGRPRFGIDMSEENLPGEIGLEERAVSFTKGCYVGQEPVARMHHRGHPNRHLRGLKLSRPAQGGEQVTKDDGAGVGTIGSTAVSPAFGPIALSVLRREIEPGDEVLVGDAPARVVPLPFTAD